MKTVLIVSHLQSDCSDNFVLPQQITFCNSNVIYNILKKINNEIKDKLGIDSNSLSDEEIEKIEREYEIVFLHSVTNEALLKTFSTTLYDKSYFYINELNDFDFINITILQK